MAYGKTVQDVFEKFLSDNDRKIAEGKDRNLKVEQLKMQKENQERAAAMDRFNQAFKSMTAKEAQDNRAVDLARQDQAIARQDNIRETQREQVLQDDQRKRGYSVEDREDKQAHDVELTGIKAQNALAKEKAKGPKLKTLGEGGLDNLSGALSTLTNSFGDLKKSAGAISKVTGPISGLLKGNNPYRKDAQILKNQLDISRQKIGKLLEGGKLIGADEEKYKRMMPSLSDTPAVFMAKLANIEKELKSDISINLESKQAAGYDTEGLSKVVSKYLSPNESKELNSINSELAEIEAQLKQMGGE